MELSITAVTAHRFLGKALRRLNPQIAALKETISKVPLESAPENILMITIMDRAGDHCQNVPNNVGILQYEIGYETGLSLRPRDAAKDDPILLRNLVEGVRTVLDTAPFSNNDRARLLRAYDQWKAQQCAAPNGGRAASVDNPNAPDGPPSVS